VRIVLVPHTHWDREWYLPFQNFRLRLVDMIDGLLETMEADPRFVFSLDGQLATIDDYLEVRPESEPRLRRLISEGRLAVGPWQILMDEFLVSGESIVRNLETGRRRAEELGGVMNVGYLPDMFGHVAQMPQILRRAGIDVAVVWRGVPNMVRSHRFLWEAPDGSTVRTEYLVGGYGNAAYLLDGGSLAERLDGFAAELEPWFGSDQLLAMYGSDHLAPASDLLAQVDHANQQGRYRVELATLDGYLAEGDGQDGELVRLRGELRSAARANMLVGVTSSRIDLKAACGRAERLLERYAEPLQALWCDSWPEEFLDLVWSRVLQNSAHDSICGCSADPVCAQVLVRFAEAEQIAGELQRRAAEAVAVRVPRGAVAVFNPSPEPRRGLVELELAIPLGWKEVALELPDGSRVGTQETKRTVPVLYQAHLPGEELARFSRRVHGRELFGRWVNAASIDDVGRTIRLEVGDEPDPADLDVEPLKRRIESLAGEEPWHVEIVEPQRRTLLADVPAPALGWTAVRPIDGVGAVEHPVRGEGHMLSNGLLEVAVAENGTLRIGPLEGVGRLVDGGDFGDSYNYAPPVSDTLVGDAESVSVALRSAGPVRGKLEVVRTYRWPLSVLPDGSARSPETAQVTVTTLVELRAGEPFARLCISFENPCSDHRLRFHTPLARPAESSSAEGQFAVVERTGVPEAGHGEVPIETYPARGFVDAGGVAVLLGHVIEYELVEQRELALTLLRATGLISRSANPWREEPAGPEVAVPDCQCRRPWSVGFAIYPHEGAWLQADVLASAERYQHEFLAAPGHGETGDLSSMEGLRIDGRGVLLSSLRRRDGGLELRLVNEQPELRDVVVVGPLAERELRLSLDPWEIRTVALG
jgi:glycosyl hydrolase family 38/alpha mannosidase-like protein